MKTWIKIILGAISFSPFLIMSGCCNPNLISGLNVRLIPQHRDWWCWAATTEMISEYYGHRVDQCESANFVHGTPPDCCTGCTGDCDCWGGGWGAYLSDIQNNWTHWGFSYVHKAGILTWDSLKIVTSTSTYCCQSPIQAVWWWDGGGGHVIAVYGYAQVGATQYVSYMNPWPPDCETNGSSCSDVTGGEDVVTTYAGFVDPPGGTWGDSFYRFKYIGTK